MQRGHRMLRSRVREPLDTRPGQNPQDQTPVRRGESTYTLLRCLVALWLASTYLLRLTRVADRAIAAIEPVSLDSVAPALSDR